MSREERLEELCHSLGRGAAIYADKYKCAADIFGAYVFLLAKEDYEMADRLLTHAKILVENVAIEPKDSHHG